MELPENLLSASHIQIWGRLRSCDGSLIRVAGLTRFAQVGAQLQLCGAGSRGARAEVISVSEGETIAMLMGSGEGVSAGERVDLAQIPDARPCRGWLGSSIDAFGMLPDGRAAPRGPRPAALRRAPPPAGQRRGIGAPVATGLAALDTLLPLCRGQRIGVFAGSGVGKSRLLRDLAHGVEADIAVIGLIGERGREVGEIAREMLAGPRGERCVVIAASSDQPATVKRRAAQLTLATAEHFRDEGNHVLCLLDSVTRYAEAHREIALSAGEAPALRAFPPSTVPAISALCERAGPGVSGDRGGDITAIFTVLVAGSDMDEPVADMVRGTLDGHIILDRGIAERGRFPAIDLRRSVSRSAPAAWTEAESEVAEHARSLIAAYEEQAPMIQVGLYQPGVDPRLDEAVSRWPALDAFVGSKAPERDSEVSFKRLRDILEAQPAGPASVGPSESAS